MLQEWLLLSFNSRYSICLLMFIFFLLVFLNSVELFPQNQTLSMLLREQVKCTRDSFTFCSDPFQTAIPFKCFLSTRNGLGTYSTLRSTNRGRGYPVEQTQKNNFLVNFTSLYHTHLSKPHSNSII